MHGHSNIKFSCAIFTFSNVYSKTIQINILRITPPSPASTVALPCSKDWRRYESNASYFFSQKLLLQLQYIMDTSFRKFKLFSTKSPSHLCVRRCMPVDYNFLLKRRSSRTLSFGSSSSAKQRPRSAYSKKPKIWKSEGAKSGLWGGRERTVYPIVAIASPLHRLVRGLA